MKRKQVTVIGLLVIVIAVVAFAILVSNDEQDSVDERENNTSDLSQNEREQRDTPSFSNVSVHDPSIIKVDDTFYVFGTHVEAARSTDLMNWTRFTNGYTTPDNTLFGDLSANLAESFEWAGENDADSFGGFAVWAPEIFWNEHYINEDGSTGAYMMHYSASSTYIRSAIGFAVSKEIEGPYEYVDTIVYSGFTENEAYDENSDVNKQWENTHLPELIDQGIISGENNRWFDADGTYNNRDYPNAIDANIFFDENDRLWMTYGSWSGGIFLLELDKETGEVLYPGEDGETEDGRMIDRYFGTKISGGYWKSGEGPYVQYNPNNGYYYLYVTYGWLEADGAYHMRQFRSESPEGPYVDADGQPAVLPGDVSNAQFGNKLMGNFVFDRQLGDPGMGTGVGYMSPGHNSVYFDPDTEEEFLVFHARFPNRGEAHEVRIHQMFMNQNGWPVVAPHRYSGESLDDSIRVADIIGEYKYINHGKDNSTELKASRIIELHEDGTLTGDVDGTWEHDGYFVEITINNITYYGVLVEVWDPTVGDYVLSFTALSDRGVSIWGTQTGVYDRTEQEIVETVEDQLRIGNTSNVVSDLTLPTTASQGTVITWESSDERIISEDGSVTRPVDEEGEVTIKATITNGDATVTKEFTVQVMPRREVGLVAHFALDGDFSDETGGFHDATVTGDRIDNHGGNITFTEGLNGQAAVFDGQSGIRLPEGLIVGDSYTVSLWLAPEEFTQHTTSFFGAMNPDSWISIVPYAHNNETIIWSGSEEWYDASTGLRIQANEWSHLAFTVDGDTISVFVNGEEQFVGDDFPDRFTSGDGYFGLGVNHWDTPYQGLMDDLYIYNGALSAQEVADKYNEFSH